MDQTFLMGKYHGLGTIFKKLDRTVKENTVKDNSDDKNNFWSNVKVGQQLVGTVVSREDQVFFQFENQNVVVPSDLGNKVQLGDRKMFQVKSVNEQIVELMMVEENSEDHGDKEHKKVVTIVKSDKDWQINSSQKSNKQEMDDEYGIKLKLIQSFITEKDYWLLEQEGFPVEEYSVEQLLNALKRIKKQPYKKEDTPSIERKNENLNDRVGKENHLSEAEIIERLQHENLPATNDMVRKVSVALNLSNTINQMNDKAITHLIGHDLPPTIENIYKACYSTDLVGGQRNRLSNEDWQELQPQIEDLLRKSDFEVDDRNMGKAKWLIERNLPISEKSLNYHRDLEQIKGELQREDVVDQIMEGLKQGIEPKDICLQPNREESYDEVLSNLHDIKDQTVDLAVKEGGEITLRKLIQVQHTWRKDSGNETLSENEKSYEATKVKRQLEELRLKMTLEGARQLERKGIDVSTEPIEKVVEALRELENEYYNELMAEVEMEVSEERLHLLKETSRQLEELRTVPSYVLGSTLPQRSNITVSTLVMEGQNLATDLLRANQAYETLMSMPMREYGDTLEKAFQNTEQLLAELGLEDSLANQRAVRVLGYNQMEITKESILHVKAYDREVNYLMEQMHPAVTVRLIKEGVNPLHVPINELNEIIKGVKEKEGISQGEKYSVFLQKLQKDGSLSAEERNNYIGIYRLLNQIGKSDGAALGSVLKAEKEVTLNHLLTAIQSQKKGRVNAIVNDEFGMLEELKNESSMARMKESLQKDDSLLQQESKYLQDLILHTVENLSPNDIKELGALSMANQTDRNSGIWETLKNQPIERLFEKLQQVEGNDNSGYDEITQKLQVLREVYKNSDQEIRFLREFQMPTSISNLLIAKQVLGNGGNLFKKLSKSQNSSDNLNLSLKEMENLADTLNDKHSMIECYESLEKTIVKNMEEAMEKETDPINIKELQTIRSQVVFATAMAKREFYQIPIVTEGEVTNINLTILRGDRTSDKKKVTISVYSEVLGRIKMDMSLQDRKLKGFVAGDNRKGLGLIGEQTGLMERVAREQKIEIKDMNYALSNTLNSRYDSSDSMDKKENSPKVDDERALYQIAKACVHMIRAAEKEAFNDK